MITAKLLFELLEAHSSSTYMDDRSVERDGEWIDADYSNCLIDNNGVNLEAVALALNVETVPASSAPMNGDRDV